MYRLISDRKRLLGSLRPYGNAEGVPTNFVNTSIRRRMRVLIGLLASVVATTVFGAVKVPETLSHAIPSPSVGVQYAQLGSSVAIDGNYTVAAVTGDSYVAAGSGAVKVFD